MKKKKEKKKSALPCRKVRTGGRFTIRRCCSGLKSVSKEKKNKRINLRLFVETGKE